MSQIRFKKFGIGMIIFSVILMIILTLLSFEPARNPDPYAITIDGKTSVEGWKTEQNYNCMGCHTLVGNGAYFAPDLTSIYADNGPAWVKAWLKNASRFPMDSDVQQSLPANMSLDEYYTLYPGAAGDVQASGGNETNMLYIGFSENDRNTLIPFLSYLSKINTNAWPPSEENEYSFAATFEQNSDRWPESFEAWVGYWILAVGLVASLLFTFFYWQSRGE